MRNNTLFGAMVATALVLSTGSAYADTDSVLSSVKVKVFGEARAFIEASDATNVDAEIKSTDSKLGVKFNSEGPIGVFGELSADVAVNGNGTDDLTTRFGYVGVNTPFGDVSLGKQMSIMEIYVDKADIFMNGGNQSVQKQDFFQKNSLKYMGTFDKVSVGGLAVMTDDSSNKDIDSWQLGAGYEGEGYVPSIGVAYARDAINDINHYGIGLSKTLNKLSLAGSFSVKDQLVDVTGYELVAGYAVSDALTVKGGYGDTDTAGDDGLVTAGAEYMLLKDALAFTTVDYDVDASNYTLRTGLSISF
jgi:hypothetical protein|tara:strand:- start:344 stop:1255 length:912 start_codon:yes stop_codon:yes gene_type:complete